MKIVAAPEHDQLQSLGHARTILTTVRLVVGNGRFQAGNRGTNDSIQGFRVHRHLDCNARRLESLSIGVRQVGADCRIKSRVLPERSYRAHSLEDVGENNDGEEQTEKYVQWNRQNQYKPSEEPISHNLKDKVGDTKAEDQNCDQ